MLNTNICILGTQALYTNSREIISFDEVMGDRFDAWNVGYNEIFSPYSSPNTNDINNDNTGIFIWNYSQDGNESKFEIYKATENGGTTSLSGILAATPPSRPMGIRVLSCDSTPTINGFQRIRIRWNHNMEPDMQNNGKKRYRIFCDTSSNMEIVPIDAIQYSENYYDIIGTVDISTGSIPEFIDSFKVSTCTDQSCGATSCWTEYPVRYRIQAIDKFNDESVLSDFASTTAWDISGGEGSMEGDNLTTTSHGSVIPKVYSLKQNYPNPFNPSTNIQYDLPIDNFVSIKVYDLIGREVMSLVNEMKEAGSYIVSFNGSNLSSGIYYYKIKAGNFEQVRKMLLIK
ncbi:MAG: T9SS type A sorting domain-containing protein [Ignavibacteria bacterium]